MKVGLFTYHFSDNYGALYQAYSLREWFHRRGIEAEFVNYHPSYVEEGGPLDRPWKPSLWRKNATVLYMKQAHFRRRLFGNRKQRRQFEQFRSEVLGVDGPRLTSPQELATEMAQYDMLVCGSDQIWNPSVQRGLDPVYFLNIAGAEHARKVAYAPSFGRTEIEPRYFDDVCRMTSQLNGLSVRESSGRDILVRAGIPRERSLEVPDPTILLGRFDELLGETEVPDESVFCYALRTDEVIRDVANEVAKQTGGKLRSPRTTHQRWSDIGEGIVPGPVEWLRTLARAGVVVSNSFHGVALSIVLNRPFVAVGLPGKRASLNARVQDLLDVTGLQDRGIGVADPDHIRALVKAPIAWERVNAHLARLMQSGEDYLDYQITQILERKT